MSRLTALLLFVFVLLALATQSFAQHDSDAEVDEELDITEGDDSDSQSQQFAYNPNAASFTPPGPNRAKLIIHKRLITPVPGLFAAERPIDVSIEVVNVGKSPAYTVSIGDNWGELFDIVEGTNSSTLDTLAVGERAFLNFTVIPQREGHFTGGAATVSYQAEGEGSRLQQAYSSGYRSFTVYATDVYEKYSRSKTLEWTVLSIGIAAAIGVPLAIWSYIQLNYKHGQAKGKKQK